MAEVNKMAALENLQQGARQATGERLSYELYDTMPLATGATELRFFMNGLGQGSTPKTLSKTNMRANGQVPQGHRFVCNALKIQYFAGSTVITNVTLQLINQFYFNSAIRFSMPGKDDFGIFKLSSIVGNGGLYTVTPAVAGDFTGIPQPIFNYGKKLDIPIILPALESFQVICEMNTAIPAALNGHEMAFLLDGVLERLN